MLNRFFCVFLLIFRFIKLSKVCNGYLWCDWVLRCSCIPQLIIVITGDGTGSTSIYGDYFEDEALTVAHNRPGYLGMANRGPDTNGCQFYITTISASWLDGKHTVFGKVLDGIDTVHAIEDVSSI